MELFAVFIDPNKWIYLCDLEDFQASKWTERSSINAFHLCRLQPFEPTKHYFFSQKENLKPQKRKKKDGKTRDDRKNKSNLDMVL